MVKDYICCIDSGGKISVYSIVTNSYLYEDNEAIDFCFAETSFMSHPVLLYLKKEIICIVSFDSAFKQCECFSSSDLIVKFEIQASKYSGKIIGSFDPEVKSMKIIGLSVNSFGIVGADGVLRKYTMYPDGLYVYKTIDCLKCHLFAYNGLFLWGLSESTLCIWDDELKLLSSVSIQGKFISPISLFEIAVLNGKQGTIISEKGEILGEFELSIMNSKYVYKLPDGMWICPPIDSAMVNDGFMLPMFLDQKGFLCMFSHPIYFQSLMNLFPFSISIPLLAKCSSDTENNFDFMAKTVMRMESPQLLEAYIASQDPQNVISFMNSLYSAIQASKNNKIISKFLPIVSIYCITKIKQTLYPELFSKILVQFRLLLATQEKTREDKRSVPVQSPPRRLREDELISFVIDSLKRNDISAALPSLVISFPDFAPFHLFRTLVLQISWQHVCLGQLNEAIKLIDDLGESPGEHLREMWRQTTRNKTRALLYEYLHKQSLLSPQDEDHHLILLKITTKYPNTSFALAQKLSSSPAIRAVADDSKLPPWQPIVDLTADFNENKSLIFPHLFKIPDEPPVESPRYFVGNIALIEAQSPKTIKMLMSEGSSVERLWILHCEHRVSDMAALFKTELEKNKSNEKNPKMKCLKFVNTYYSQMNVYELETLLDILCQYGYFSKHEVDNFELLLVRICKNKYLFDPQWWQTTSLDFAQFFKQFSEFCAKKTLFMPFEMFVISHPRAKDVDLSDLKEPLIRFIWDLWIKRDPAAATLSCMQYIAKSNSTDPVELWQHLPNDSLAPLASFVWNKDPNKFKPGNPETEALSERLKGEYPLLSSLVKGEIPHPKGPQRDPPESKWRSPIFTSKFDLELHDLIASHFDYDFSKVFTDYYGRTPGQPPFPHFDHPELITAPSEPPYIHYVKSMLPVSAFQQALDDGIDENTFFVLCTQCLKEAFTDKEVRLACLTFVELTDIQYGKDNATDYKLLVSIYDKLNGSGDNQVINDLINIFKTKSKEIALKIQKKLSPTEIEVYLLAALLGVRCDLPLDYSAISAYSKRARPAELLLFIDRAGELGAKYPINQIVKIVTDEMPENPLKAHLLFHLTQSLPAEEGPSSTDIPPALVVYRAVRKAEPSQQYLALLQEAINRKTQLYALLATSIEGANILLCALVTLLTMSDNPSQIDLSKPIDNDKLVSMFLSTINSLLQSKKSLELMQTLELFSESSIALQIVYLYRSVELFAFRRTDSVVPSMKEKLSKEIIEDDLMGKVKSSVFFPILHPMIDSLVRHCSAKSQIHVFRFLQCLDSFSVSTFLEPRVKLCKVISSFENYRRAIVHCDLLGNPEQIVSELVLNHSLALGQSAAQCLGTSSASATKQWLAFQYSTAATPSQLLEIHRQVIPDIQNPEKNFFISLYASMLPYCQPVFSKEILVFARSLFTGESKLSKNIDALLLHLAICSESGIEVVGPPGSPPTISELLEILFPKIDPKEIGYNLPLSIASPLLFGFDTLHRFFETSTDKAIDYCLDKRRVSDARILCEWRDRDPHNIQLLEAVQCLISGDVLSSENQGLLKDYSKNSSDLESILDLIAKDKQWRFVLISLHYKAAKRLGYPTNNLLHRQTIEFVQSELSICQDNWQLIHDLIKTSRMSVNESSNALVESFTKHMISCIIGGKAPKANELSPTDYGERFIEFSKLCESSSAVGDSLFEKAKAMPENTPIPVKVNLILHSSLCTTDLDECAEALDSLLDLLTNDSMLPIIIDIVSVFPDPALLPRFFQYLIAQQKLDSLPHERLSEKVGRVIMNCARHVCPFEPQNYFNLTLKYGLLRDHAELQMDCGNRDLQGNPDKPHLQEASRHFLLALAYFLHEKCYSLSMECLKKLSLISLQLELSEPQILHLEKQRVLQLMCQKDFPFALTIAVAYDMDTEANWAEALYTQSVANKGEEFLTAFQYFRPITSTLSDGVVRKYKASTPDESQKDRMKQFLLNIPNLVERYRIAKSLDFHDQIETMKEVNPVVCEWCERVLMNKQ